MVQTNAAREDRRQHPKQGAEILGRGPYHVNLTLYVPPALAPAQPAGASDSSDVAESKSADVPPGVMSLKPLDARSPSASLRRVRW